VDLSITQRGAILPARPPHHGHIRPALIRDWSPKMDGITATIWASQTTLHGSAREN
jgi:hypothetical protein